MANPVKKTITILWLLMIFSGIVGIFWYTDWRYSLPTPVPQKYHPVALGAYIDLGGKLPIPDGKPVFLHFFNPDCPCSRFNVPFFKSLAQKYKGRITFAIVVLNNNTLTEKQIQDRFDIDAPVSFDSAIAASCGVYSTPQAVLLDANRRLYYRGNYNKSRYCTDTRSNYADIAIDSLLNHAYRPVFSPLALKAYGCTLPVCTQK